MTRTLFTLVALVTLPTLGGCDATDMSRLEAADALESARQSTHGEATIAEAVDISTDLTIDITVDLTIEERRDRHAQTIAAWWATQADCAETTVDAGTVVVDFGSLDDACDFAGYHYGGVATFAVDQQGEDVTVVTHSWDGFNNGDTQVDGTGSASIDWDVLERTVVTDHTWTRLGSGNSVDVTGERLQTFLVPSERIWGGVNMDGTRSWVNSDGEWELDMIDVEWRLQDPVPQAGTYTLVSPAGKDVSIRFDRIDADTIRATTDGTRRSYQFDVTLDGTTDAD